ncbi:MAG: polysaccharide biosynthesis protein [Oscillospiraceae bacterium]|nr:polysaccharide biosynthesis protein [Oscillospiraceae bacterium]
MVKYRSKIGQAVVFSALLLTGINLFSQVLGFIYRVWLSRLVSPEVIGLYGLIMPLYTIIMSLCVSGLTVAVSRLTAHYSALGQEGSIRQTVKTARIGYILMVLALSAFMVPLSDQVSVHFLGDARTRLALLILVPEILLTGWENVHKNYFYGRKNIVPPATAEIAEQITRVGSTLALLYLLRPTYEEHQLGLIIVGMTISEVFSAAILTIFYRRDQKKRIAVIQHESGMLRRVLSIAVPVAGANLLSNLITSLNSIIIPGRLIMSGLDPNEALSAFGVAFGMTMPLLSLPLAFTVSIGLVMLPRLSESAALKDLDAIRRKTGLALLLSGMVIVACMSILIPFGAPLAQMLFKNADAGQFMAPLAIATVFVCLEQILASFLNGLGRQKKAAADMIAAGVVQLVLTWFFVAHPGLRLMGFVWAYLVSNIMGASLCLWDMVKVLRRSAMA